MATLTWTDDALSVSLTRWERFGTMQRAFTIPRDHLDSAQQIHDLWPHVRGWRWPGIGIPHVILLGRMRSRDGTDFCAIYNSRPGIIIGLHDEPYSRLLISTPDQVAKDLVQRITR